MSDNPPPEPTPPAEAGTPTTITNVDTEGGANIAGEVNVASGGEFVGRDKTIHIHEAPTPIATSLHQLPPPPHDFTGREAKLAELMAKAEIYGVTLSGLQGIGSVGKTVLVLVQTDYSLTLIQYGHRMSSN